MGRTPFALTVPPASRDAWRTSHSSSTANASREPPQPALPRPAARMIRDRCRRGHLRDPRQDATELGKRLADVPQRTPRVYKRLGSVTHRDIGPSLWQAPALIRRRADAALLRLRLAGQAVTNGWLGGKPIGRADVFVDAALDYQLPWLPHLSVNARVVYEGRTPTRPIRSICRRQRFDLGTRYRTRIGGVPTMFRVQVRNVGDVYGWKESSGVATTMLGVRVPARGPWRAFLS